MHITPLNIDPQQASAKEKILFAAHELFYLHGIRATGIDKIIEQAKVTKVTFYRHFPSKNDLIMAYLAYRHDLWMHGFCESLDRRIGQGEEKVAALISVMTDWWQSPGFRGCAFLNATAEIGEALPDVAQQSRDHKIALCKQLAQRWGVSEHRKLAPVVMAMDGAIMQAQMGMPTEEVAHNLRQVLQAIA